MKFMRETAKCTLFDHKRNCDFLKKMQPLLEEISNHKNKWIHIRRRADPDFCRLL
jgi:hypothetical protein